MKSNDQATLSQVSNKLVKKGYTDDFKAGEHSIKAVYGKKEYKPHELKIVHTYRFEGMTNPSDQSVLFAIEANDGVKGTLTMAYNYESEQNEELIKQIPIEVEED
ncbi:MAG: phosphoribosylpyrophosphate synthetase [Cyclobacteriaceae bacterium]|nr:phosphoribosylpyrophosphate synthetase [Cyclobacteriaceae bacterium]